MLAGAGYFGLTLFFPAVYFHFDQRGAPFNLTGHGCDDGGGGTNNDGLWESRFLVSRDGAESEPQLVDVCVPCVCPSLA